MLHFLGDLLVWHVCPSLVRAIATNLSGMCVGFVLTCMLHWHVCPPLVRAIATNLSGMCVCFVLTQPKCILNAQIALLVCLQCLSSTGEGDLVWHVHMLGFDLHVESSSHVACLACLSSIGEGDYH